MIEARLSSRRDFQELYDGDRQIASIWGEVEVSTLSEGFVVGLLGGFASRGSLGYYECDSIVWKYKEGK